ncbi:hypothetical protein [Acinetobacter sp.]|uniref:hypothetical protein n=1 Tax=Acinetobacter sp. TaxID=472 RepID=UPI0035B3CDE1
MLEQDAFAALRCRNLFHDASASVLFNASQVNPGNDCSFFLNRITKILCFLA